MANSETVSIGPGIAVYPRLKTPDTKFDELGVYKADISVPLADAQPIIDRLQAVHKKHTGKVAPKAENPMFVMETDEAGEETGNVIFKCRVKNKLRKKDGQLWDRRPKQFDAQLRPIDVNPYGGTEMIVSAEIYEWVSGNKKGVSLQPIGVQILNLVTGSGPSGEGMGFQKRDGYTADDSYGGSDDEGEDDGADMNGDDDSIPEDGDY